MNFNPITMVFILVFVLPIFNGFINKFSSEDLKQDLIEIEKSISFILALILGIYVCKNIFIEHSWEIYALFPQQFINFFDESPYRVYILLLPVIFYLIYKIIFTTIYLINVITFNPVLDSMERFFAKKNQFLRRIMGAIFQLPRAICYILLIAFALNFISITNISKDINNYLQQSSIYNYVCRELVIPITNSKLARQLPQIINNSFKIEIKSPQNIKTSENQNFKNKTIVYYNGVTLEEGIESNKEIDEFAKKLVQNQKTDKAKARALYSWIGLNIEYDYDKANRVLNNDFKIKSGAIPTFESKKGICFDYSCLYVAMCRATGLKVRIVTGEGFNGISWVSHAWNQVYISEEDKWINVDATFYKGGNYFNTKRFELDHKGENAIGEW